MKTAFNQYGPSHLFHEPAIVAIEQAATCDSLPRIVKSPAHGVFTFNLFGRKFCRALLEEVDRHADKQEAPNTMNRYGLVLKDAGLGWLCKDLLQLVVEPLRQRYYPHLPALRSYHGFIVNYERRKQGSLDLHEDESLVTLNVCLGRNFSGGKLVFRERSVGVKKLASVEHRVGRAVLHLGSQLHEAQRIRSGQRRNLILWCK